MKNATAILIAASLYAYAGQVAVDLDPVSQKGTDWLVYDDGTGAWLSWGGMYRGVWFDVQDFIPGAAGFTIYKSEFWFYHHASYPWDTSDVYIEVWNGDNTAPIDQLDQTMVTAVHYSPVYATYSIPLETQQNFWALANTEMSSGGWPSSLSDGTPGNHSFFSDDFIIWEPWGETGDYFVRVGQNWALANTTWGSIKTVFE